MVPKTRKVVTLPISSLRLRAHNARIHNRKQLRKLADSIVKFGFVNPVLIDGTRTIIAGHGRVQAAKLAGVEEVPTITVSHLSPEEVRAYVIADNQLAALAGWDKELLSLELAEIAELAPALDLTITGFDADQLRLLQDVAGSRQKPIEENLELLTQERPTVTAPGDCWQIGTHRLICGDALDASNYAELLGKRRADLVIADGPYNVPIDKHVSGSGRTKHREFLMASGEMTQHEFQRFLYTSLSNAANFSRSGSLHFYFMDWRSIDLLLAAGEEVYDSLLNIIVWKKPRPGLGSLYRSQHELIALFKKGIRSHKNNIALGGNGRSRTNIWEYSAASSFHNEQSPTHHHPTVKNLEMITEAIRDVSDPGDLVLDPFGGSGTTLIAAEQCGRVARLIELDPSYCDLTIRRALALGLTVTLRDTGEAFVDAELRRSNGIISRLGDASPDPEPLNA